MALWLSGRLHQYYNTDRLHWVLDIDNYKVPMMAFRNKAATDDVRRKDLKWVEVDING